MRQCINIQTISESTLWIWHSRQPRNRVESLSALVWKHLVGLTKNALKKTRQNLICSLQTIIVEIKAHLNNRPLTYVISELNEPEPLTLSHLLYGVKLWCSCEPVSWKSSLDNSSCVVSVCGIALITLEQEGKGASSTYASVEVRIFTSLRETHTTSGGSNKEVGDILIHDDCPRLKQHLAVVQELQWRNEISYSYWQRFHK